MMLATLFAVFLLFATGYGTRTLRYGKSWSDLPEEHMDAYQLITTKGYPCEEYEVQTEDGYRLTIQRIPHGLNQAPSGNRTVVFLQHGLLCASTNWITNLANESFGFLLADAGFDVWLGNFRGNTYGMKHATLTPDQREFWQFSWDEMAQYDLPAMINFALTTSGQSQLYYVGHSEGTMTAFAKFSSDLAFGQKIKRFFALGPVSTVKYISGALAWLAPFTSEIGWFCNLVGYNDFLPNDWLMDQLAKYVCGWSYTDPVCVDVLFLIAGTDTSNLNQTRIPVYVSHTPAGTSTQNVVHFGQQVKSGLFQMYDYGSDSQNMLKYGQVTPPVYPLENMQVPVALYWGAKDILADPTDVAGLIPRLNSLYNNVGLPDFNHLDFIWGMNAPGQVYQPIIQQIKRDLASQT